MPRRLYAFVAAALALVLAPYPLAAQGGAAARTPRSDSLRTAARLDTEGFTADARKIFQALVDNAPDPASKAAAQRAMAMSYAFDGDCVNAVNLEEQVIAYWSTREQAEPQNAWYQEGEMANEAGRVCIDAGNIDLAEKMYRRGTQLGQREPEPRVHPRVLWDYRLAHALARIAARRGQRAEAGREVAEARRLLDSDTAMASAQERYYPYLVGYVALYTGDYEQAQTALTNAVQANATDPFMHYLLGMTYEKLKQPAKAKEFYQKAYDLAAGHNPPAAFTRPAARKKLAL
jgi:tetratricopeptide (TPR) repeat protein